MVLDCGRKPENLERIQDLLAVRWQCSPQHHCVAFDRSHLHLTVKTGEFTSNFPAFPLLPWCIFRLKPVWPDIFCVVQGKQVQNSGMNRNVWICFFGNLNCVRLWSSLLWITCGSRSTSQDHYSFNPPMGRIPFSPLIPAFPHEEQEQEKD